MPTHHDETLLERYQREHREFEEFRMNKHTNGKLTVVDNSWEVSSIYDESRLCIAVCHIYPGATEETQAEHEFRKEANARRLVACWNACDLMPTEDIERLAEIGEGVMRLSVLADDNRAERDRLSAINAELLEALKDAATYLSGHQTRNIDTDKTALESVRAAIAKAQGEQT